MLNSHQLYVTFYDIDEDGVARAAYANGYITSNKETSSSHNGDFKISYEFTPNFLHNTKWEEIEDWIMKEADEIVI